jgi:hypothetical protein
MAKIFQGGYDWSLKFLYEQKFHASHLTLLDTEALEGGSLENYCYGSAI